MKLYATTTSDKGGREAKKGGDSWLFTKISRGNTQLGILRVYEIMSYENDGKPYNSHLWKAKGGYRIYWQDSNNGKEIEIYNSDNDKRTA